MMKRNGQDYTLDDIREEVHAKLAPCSNENEEVHAKLATCSNEEFLRWVLQIR